MAIRESSCFGSHVATGSSTKTFQLIHAQRLRIRRSLWRYSRDPDELVQDDQPHVGGRDLNQRPTDYESLGGARATRQDR